MCDCLTGRCSLSELLVDYSANYAAIACYCYGPCNCQGYSVRYLPFVGRALKAKYGFEEFIFPTKVEAIAFWRKIRHERRGEKLTLLRVLTKYSRYTLATWDPKRY